MIEKQIEKVVIESLKEFLISVKKEAPVIDRRTKPIGDLGLESQDGIDWICDLDKKGIDVPNNINPFWDDDENRGRNIAEIVNLLFNICNNSEDK